MKSLMADPVEHKLQSDALRLWRNLVTVPLENMEVQMCAGGLVRTQKGITEYHTHLYHEMFYVEAGEVDLLTPNGVYAFHPNDCFIVPAGVEHFRRKYWTDVPPRVMDLRFTIRPREDAPADAADVFGPMRRAVECGRDFVRVPQAERLREIYADIVRGTDDEPWFFELRTEALLTALFIDLYRLIVNEDLPAPEEMLCQLPEDGYASGVDVEWILDNRYGDPNFRVTELASTLGLSVRQTERLLMKRYQVSFKQKLMEVRLKNASSMLRYTTMPLSEIAAACGYSSHSGLSKAFRESFGMTPGEYRLSNAPTKTR